MSSFVCSDYTVLAIVEGMRNHGIIEKTRRDSIDMAEALRVVNEHMTCKRWKLDQQLGKWALQQNHMPVTADVRPYGDGEVLAAIQCYLYQVETGEAMDFDFITIVAAVKMLREKILEGDGFRKGKDGYQEFVDDGYDGYWQNIAEVYEWDLTE